MIELKQILLVEDNPNDVELTLGALSEYNLGNEVQVCRDGEEALDFLYKRGAFAGLQEGYPAVILLDLKLPKVDGHEVLRIIRSDDKMKLVPVVVLTSSHEERDRGESYMDGANAYVVKPVNFNDFVKAIKELGLFWAIINEPPPGSIRKRL